MARAVGVVRRTLSRSSTGLRWFAVVGASVVLLLPLGASGFLSTARSTDRSWQWQNELPQGNPVRSLSFTSADTGWASGRSGTLLRTLDGGLSWSSIDVGTSTDWNAVSFASTDTGWVAGEAGIVRKTINAGSTWTTQPIGTGVTLRGLAARDATNAVLVGDASGGGNSTLRYTTDGGTTWRSGTSTSSASLHAVAYPSSGLAWAVGSNGTMLKSSDGGQTWIAAPQQTAASLNGVAFARNTATGYAVGSATGTTWNAFRTTDGTTWSRMTLPGTAVSLMAVATSSNGGRVSVSGANGTVYVSTDGGTTWSARNPDKLGSSIFRAIAMPADSRINVGNDKGMLLFSRTTGASWHSEMHKTRFELSDTSFADADNGFAVGMGGLLMRTTNAAESWSAKIISAQDLRGVHFVSPSTGWVVGNSGTVKVTTDAGATWTTQTVPALAASATLNDVSFRNSNVGVAVGSGGVIIRTTNGGATWITIESGTTQPLHGVSLDDSTQSGWAVGGGGVILATTDAGASWTRQASPTTLRLNDVHAESLRQAMVVGALGTALKTVDGKTWTNLSSAVNTPENLNAVFMSDTLRAWVGGDAGVLRATVDGGKTFTTQNAKVPTGTDGSGDINALSFRDNSRGYLVGDDGAVRATANGGGTWLPSFYGTLQSLNGVDRRWTSDVWAVGDGGTILNTFDAGSAWFRQPSGTAANLSGIRMTSNNRGWAVGAAGTIRYTVNNGWTWTSQTSGTTVQLTAVDSLDGTNAVTVGDGVALYTSNAGATWNAASSLPSSRTINDVSLATTTTGWAVASAGGGGATVMRTTDAGATWVSQFPTPTIGFNAVHFRPDALTGWVAGPQGRIFKTLDGGSSWTPEVTGTTDDILDISFSSDTTGVATGVNGALLKTVDGGITWLAQDSGTRHLELRSAALLTTHEGWIVGESGLILNGYDQSVPLTTLIVSPALPDGSDDWYVTYPTAQLVASEPGTTWYSWSGGAGSYAVYTGPLLVPQGTATLHYYTVDLGGNTEGVKTHDFKVDAVSPSSPTTVAVSGIASSSATVTWTASTDIGSGLTGYQVLLNGSYYQSSGATQASLADLSPNTTYVVTIKAVDAAGNLSVESSPTTFTTLDAVGAALGTQITVSAPASPDGLSSWYVNRPTVELTSVPSGIASTIKYAVDSTSTPTTYTAPFLAPSGDYRLWYWSESAGRGTSYLYTDFKVDPNAAPAPTGLEATQTGPYSAALTWDDVSPPISGLGRYDVYLDGALHGSTVDTSYAAIGLSPSTTYSFTVRSVSVAGTQSPFSAAVLATTTPPPVPSPPAIVYAKATDGQTVYVNWTPSPDSLGATSYHVWRSANGLDYSVVATITANNQFSWVDSGRKSSTEYWYGVSAIDMRGEGPYGTGPSGSSSTTTGAPPRVRGLSVLESERDIALTWPPSSNTNVTGYVVYRSSASLSTATTLTAMPITSTFYLDSAVNNGDTYWYRVAAVDASGAIGSKSAESLGRPVNRLATDSPHGSDTDRSDNCAGCHRGHSGAAEDLLMPPGPTTGTAEPTLTARATLYGQRGCLSCHDGSNGTDIKTYVESTTEGSRHSIETSTNAGLLYCGSCHVSHRSNIAESDASLLDVDGFTEGTGICYGCHGEGSTLPGGDLRVFENSAHRPASTSSRAGIVCQECHNSHTSANEQLLTYSGYMLCVQCHSGEANPYSPDILDLLSAGDDPSMRHDLTASDQAATGSRITCRNCHNSMSLTSTRPLVDPDDPSTDGAWQGGTIQFCFRCHDGELPTAEQTAGLVDAPLAAGGATTTIDIESAYNTNVHGFGEATSAVLYTDMGYPTGSNETSGAVMSCTVCHGGHGTVNSYALRQDVYSASGAIARQGLAVAPTSGGGYDTRFFCQACHELTPASHLAASGVSIASFPIDCTAAGCHRHTGGSYF